MGKFKLNRMRVCLLIGLLPFLLIILGNLLVQNAAKGNLYSEIAELPKNKVGLVLGTVKTLKNGRVNRYFKYRVQAAHRLFAGGKIDYILVSGDNGNKAYDEPTDFKNALMDLGVPEKKIILDYAGFRTLDSVVRAKEIFGQNKLTIISQKFHNERAVYLAKSKGIDAVAFNAKTLSGKNALRMRVREWLARTAAFLDVMWGTQPKFLGERIKIG